jgi:hypothetical protein
LSHHHRLPQLRWFLFLRPSDSMRTTTMTRAVVVVLVSARTKLKPPK